MGRILIYISLIILLRYAYTYVNNRSEYFENHLNLLDNVDEVYAKFYNIVFNESFVFDYDYKIIKNTLKKNSRILDAGTGTGKYYNYFIKNYDIIGVDMSRDFLKHAKINSPLGKFVEGNLINPGLFKLKQFSHILCLLETLYHNNYKNQALILKNFYKWLEPNGYLFIHIFDYKKLVPSPRNYSTLYVDDYKNLHSYTEFPNFNHDAYYIKDDNNVTYKEKYTMNKTKKIRMQETKLYIPKNKEKTIKQILEVGFKLYDTHKMEFYDDTDLVLYVFKK
tara:strand:+ start:1680 stop:2516 length:837 start_codon:yes stop_codon:yes gene_type:complete